MPRRTPAHRADVVRRGALTVANFGKTSAALVAAMIIALVAANGTFAYFRSQSSVALVPASSSTTATVTAGTASLSVSTPAAFAAVYPGSLSRSSVVVTNTGNVTLALTIGSLVGPTTPTPFSQSLTVTVFPVSAGNPCSGTAAAPAGSWSGTFASSSTASLSTTVAAGATSTLCISLALATAAPATAASSSAAAFSLAVGGEQA